MVLLTEMNFDLPLRNPVIIFSLVLFIILFAPILFNKIRIPHIIGLILAGVIVGPYGLNLLRRDASIVLFGTVGLMYIMFLAGLEIDLTEFKKNRSKILVFGLCTFLLPMIAGTLAGYYLLDYDLMASLLLAAMMSTHTLIAYPIASRYGVNKNIAVTISVGGTMITDILALLILAGVAGMAKEEVSSGFWLTLGAASLVFVGIVFFVFPPIIRWFFTRFDDSVSQYIFVLAIVFLACFLAEAAGLEAIIGAFFSGLVLNRFVPHTSPLMNRINFVGNALFIPFFLISVGMLVDITVFGKGLGAIKVAAVLIVIAITTKYLAAVITRKTFKLDKEEGNLIFGLSTARAAATLAIVLVGYNIITGETPDGAPIRLLGEDVLNGAMLLILVSCTYSSFVVERACRKIALEEEKSVGEEHHNAGAILIALARPEAVAELVDFGLMLKPKKSAAPLYALHVISDEPGSENAVAAGKKMLDKAVSQAVGAEHSITPLTRHDANVSNGIIYTIKEKRITNLIIGLHRDATEKDFLGATAERLISRMYETVFIYKPVQPINTLNRMVVLVTPRAELEPGFDEWFHSFMTIAKAAGMALVYYAHPDTIEEMKSLQDASAQAVPLSYQRFDRWEDFLFFTGVVKRNDLFTIVCSRDGYASYNPVIKKLPYFLTNYFSDNSVLLLYPQQLERGIKMDNVQYTDTSIPAMLAENSRTYSRMKRVVKRLFGR